MPPQLPWYGARHACPRGSCQPRRQPASDGPDAADTETEQLLTAVAAVVMQIDAEMDARLQAISDGAEDDWAGFCKRCRAYLKMALEPEIQRIVLRDARAVLGGATPEAQGHCVSSMQKIIDRLMQQGVVAQADAQALASMIYGSLAEAAFWIADAEDGSQRLQQATQALELLLRGLLAEPGSEGRRVNSAG
ncbi:TetR/AcrR family transcriptional regulator [Kerstersia gyiorum]|uniref:TetR/AcrR family transcriptional regulator n=1 Tax=Kerstersia gyiorum TaxID=206506 RepID=UPI00193112B7|nr:TetR/AcrR family transcriptional regulator [Kerstersia gyiorum]